MAELYFSFNSPVYVDMKLVKSEEGYVVSCYNLDYLFSLLFNLVPSV